MTEDINEFLASETSWEEILPTTTLERGSVVEISIPLRCLGELEAGDKLQFIIMKWQPGSNSSTRTWSNSDSGFRIVNAAFRSK